MRIVGGDIPFTVGQMAHLSCISDAMANEILWLDKYERLAEYHSARDQGANHLNYTINLVNDSIHKKVFTCQVRGASNDEMFTSVNITISVTGN